MENSGVMDIKLRTGNQKGDNNQLKREGYILGNIVGKGVDSVAIAVKKDEFLRTIKKMGRNAVLTLVVSDDTKYTVMTKDIDIEPIKNQIFHLNFEFVSLSEKLTQEVAITIIGSELLESKRLLINSSLNSILVEGLPQDIPDYIELDVSNLDAGGSIQFSEVKLPAGITANLDPDYKLVTVTALKVREETEEDESSESASE